MYNNNYDIFDNEKIIYDNDLRIFDNINLDNVGETVYDNIKRGEPLCILK